jgi:hypothetical protein
MEVTDNLLPSAVTEEPVKKSSWTLTIAGVAVVVLGSVAFINSYEKQEAAMLDQVDIDAQNQCMKEDTITLYKNTIASSSAHDDALWAAQYLGCTVRDVTDTHGCAELGKTSCLSDTLGFNLHFVTNENSIAGDKDVAYWDHKVSEMNGDMENFNKFMDFRVVFYTPRLDNLVATVLLEDTKFLLRSNYVESTDETWYSLIFSSPSSKMFEVTSTKLNLKDMSETVSGKKYLQKHGGVIKSWDDEAGTCPHTQTHSTLQGSMTSQELDAKYYELNAELKGGKTAGLLPLRNQIAVSNLAKLESWYNKQFPSLSFSRTNGNTEKCSSASLILPLYTDNSYKMETRFVENNEMAPENDVTVKEFINYIESVHSDNVAPNRGWDAWYDRHLGFMVETCPIDNYMSHFYRNDIAFNPHGRPYTTDNTGAPTQHCWVEGTEGYGIEMQGAFDFSFRDCYTVFDWCSQNSNGAQFCSDGVMKNIKKEKGNKKD